jgi:hypothetical protein
MAFVAKKTCLLDGGNHAKTNEERFDAGMCRFAWPHPRSGVALEQEHAEPIGTRGDCGGGAGGAAANNNKVGLRNRLHDLLRRPPRPLVLAPEEHGVGNLTVEFLCDARAATPDIIRQVFAP